MFKTQRDRPERRHACPDLVRQQRVISMRSNAHHLARKIRATDTEALESETRLRAVLGEPCQAAWISPSASDARPAHSTRARYTGFGSWGIKSFQIAMKSFQSLIAAAIALASVVGVNTAPLEPPHAQGTAVTSYSVVTDPVTSASAAGSAVTSASAAGTPVVSASTAVSDRVYIHIYESHIKTKDTPIVSASTATGLTASASTAATATASASTAVSKTDHPDQFFPPQLELVLVCAVEEKIGVEKNTDHDGRRVTGESK
ncbi:hypothetical protein DFH08DRAFT_812092 [Mycena albidolilacea]|uniref:Uncharacterized protein n=1 Tax=Mycena albidolilacea TaxID=1033008 RepID=A0AAD6ZTZ4_9AGAR|nr:hypothetical protein DFH08DRAFT_812092 [Mycena albidolilacea]